MALAKGASTLGHVDDVSRVWRIVGREKVVVESAANNGRSFLRRTVGENSWLLAVGFRRNIPPNPITCVTLASALVAFAYRKIMAHESLKLLQECDKAKKYVSLCLEVPTMMTSRAILQSPEPELDRKAKVSSRSCVSCGIEM